MLFLPVRGLPMRIWKPNVTVAAVVERDGRFLVVEEETDDGLRFNQPAGHLDEGESLVQAAAREALEETAHQFRPEFLVGIYQWPRPAGDITYLRFAFGGAITGFAPDESRRASRHARASSQPADPAVLRRLHRRPAFSAGSDPALRRLTMRVLVPCLAAFFVGLSAGPVMADERVEICYNYGCLVRADVVFSELRLVEIAGRLRLADSAVAERAILARVVGQLYRWAGEQSPIGADRPGNYLDFGANGMIDDAAAPHAGGARPAALSCSGACQPAGALGVCPTFFGAYPRAQ